MSATREFVRTLIAELKAMDADVIVEDCRACDGTGDIEHFTGRSRVLDGSPLMRWSKCEYCKGLGTIETRITLRSLDDILEEDEEKAMATDAQSADEEELGKEFELEPDEWATIVDAIVALDIRAGTETTAKLRKEFESLRDYGPALIAL